MYMCTRTRAHRYGQKVAERGGKVEASNWYYWLNVEPAFYRFSHALVKLALWASLFAGVLLKLLSNTSETFDPDATAGQMLLAHQMQLLIGHLIIFVPLAILFLAAAKLKGAIIQACT